MSFGSRRFLTGGTSSIPTRILFDGSVRSYTTAAISDDVNGNTVLGNGSYRSADDLLTNVGTGGFSNCSMNILLTPNRYYNINIIRDTSEGSDRPWPYVKTNVAATTASVDVRYSRITNLSNPPEGFADVGAIHSFGTSDIGSGEPTVDGSVRTFLFDDAPWVDNKINMIQGLFVPTTDNNTSVSIGSNHTPLGINAFFSVAQSSNGGSSKVVVEVSEL